MRLAFILVASLMLSVSAFAADDTADTANRAKFEKECAVMIAPGGPCADVPKGDEAEEAVLANLKILRKQLLLAKR
jgi:hypothetical protein